MDLRGKEFGTRLRWVRKIAKLELMDVARRTLPPEATDKELRDRANYFSRLERRGGNPRLDLLQALGHAFNMESVAAFLLALEVATDPAIDAGQAIKSLLNGNHQAHSQLSLSGKADSDASPAPALTVTLDQTSIERLLLGASEVLVTAINRLGDRLETRRQADS